MAKNSYVHLLKHSFYKEMEWKNKKGTTKEISVFPPQSTLDNFIWRFSSATITQASEFSSYPNYERIFAILNGKLKLEINSQEKQIDPQKIYVFDGNEPILATPFELPVNDLNFIYEKNKISAVAKMLPFSGKPRSFAFKNKTAIFYVVKGQFSVSCYPNEINFNLEENDSIILNELFENNKPQECIALFEPKTTHSLLIGIEIVKNRA